MGRACWCAAALRALAAQPHQSAVEDCARKVLGHSRVEELHGRNSSISCLLTTNSSTLACSHTAPGTPNKSLQSEQSLFHYMLWVPKQFHSCALQ